MSLVDQNYRGSLGYEFQEFPDQRSRLFVPMKKIQCLCK